MARRTADRGAAAADAGQLGFALVPDHPCACGATAWHRPLGPDGQAQAAFACMACHAGCALCAQAVATVVRAEWNQDEGERSRRKER